MSVKHSLMAAVLCLSSVGLVHAKSHSVILSEPAMAGNIQLPAGEYEVKLPGNNAVMTNVDKDKTFTAPVSVVSDPAKHDRTALLTDQAGGESHIQAIEFGKSHTKLVFDQQ